MEYSKEFEEWFKKQSHLSILEQFEIEEVMRLAWEAWQAGVASEVEAERIRRREEECSLHYDGW